VSFPFDLHSAVVFDPHMPCQEHAGSVPCHDHVIIKATSQDHGTARHGRGMGAAWARHGRSMDSAWERHGRGMGAAWARHGRGMDAAWARHGYGMACLNYYRPSRDGYE
jgi:hypothetical protein